MTREEKISAAMQRIHRAAKTLAYVDPLKAADAPTILAYDDALTEMRRAFDALDRAELMEKLVRDRIPAILRAKGIAANFRRTSSNAEYVELLEAKLREEVGEWFASRSIEELADVIEVVFALSTELGTPEATLMQLRSEKSATRGAFWARHVLIAETDDSR